MIDQGHVLYVEDNEATRYVVNRVLANAGYRVTAAAQGDRGVALARADQPDLVLLDVKLPDTTGFDVCRRLKSDAETKGIPIVFLSASHVSSHDKVAGLEGGADLYLTHPVEPHVLVATLGALLRVRRAEAKYRRLAGSNVVGVAEFDAEGRIIDANEEFLRLSGYAPEDVREGRLLWGELISPEWRDRSERLREEYRRTGALPAHETEIVRRDGGRVPLLVATAALLRHERGITVVVDLTDRKRVEREREEALRRAEAAQGRLAFLLSISNALMLAPEGVGEALRRVAKLCAGPICDWCVIDRLVAPRTAERAAVAAADPAGEAAGRVIAARTPAVGEAAVGRALATGDVQRLEGRVDATALEPVADPEHREALRTLGVGSAVVRPLVAGGRVLGALTLVRSARSAEASPVDAALGEEVAARIALALDTARLHEELSRAVRAREDALAEVSHELRNPLSSVILAAIQLERSADAPQLADVVRRRAGTLRRSGERMNRLVNDLLDLARFESGHLTLELGRHAAAGIVSEAVDAAEAQLRELGVEARVEAPSGLTVECDRERILRVLLNLLSNAAKASPRGGTVEVSVAAAGEDVAFSVRDQGPGIPAAQRAHLFERYWQGRGPGEGVGLGLSIVKALVEAHGGRMSVASAPGSGSTFAFRIPASQAARVRAQASQE